MIYDYLLKLKQSDLCITTVIWVMLFLIGIMSFTVNAQEKQVAISEIQSQLSSSGGDDVSVIVELEDLFGESAFRSSSELKNTLMVQLSQTGTSEISRFENFSIMALNVDQSGLEILNNSVNVKNVYLNKLRKGSLNTSTVQVQADQARAKNKTGNGVTIALLDAGFNGFTDMFNAPGKIVGEACFTTTINIQGIQLYGNCWPNNSDFALGEDAAAQTCNPCTAGNEHGSLVAGVAVGNADEYSPMLKGVATGANILPVNVFSRTFDSRVCGSGNCVVALDSDIFTALDYIYAHKDKYKIAAVNMSLGGGAFSSACDNVSPYANVANLFKQSNIAIIAAAGNAGSRTSISEPACVSSILAVGSVGATNQVSTFSNSNSLIDFWAPGENITTDSGGCLNCYESVSGTSFSAPHVSGAFAILRSHNVTLTVDEITTLLKTSGLSVTDPLNGLTRPLIQINDALAIAPTINITPSLYYLLLTD